MAPLRQSRMEIGIFCSQIPKKAVAGASAGRRQGGDLARGERVAGLEVGESRPSTERTPGDTGGAQC